MGVGYDLHCDNCGYKLEAYFGVGMFFSQTYEETLTKAREGKLGRRAKKFLREHPDGAIDCSLILAQCIYCGQYETVSDLTMYLPKKNAPADILPWELRKYCKAFAAYPHTCKHCGGDMKLISERTFVRRMSNLKCPKCHRKFDEPGIIMWD
ncbi:MAG: hypothetical protein IJ774_07045 [Selenomonadaceae bacterium]|nr:hypothetical protein [Selenomonadaceae bacterium]